MDYKVQKLAIAVGDVVNLVELKGKPAISEEITDREINTSWIRSCDKNSGKVCGGTESI